MGLPSWSSILQDSKHKGVKYWPPFQFIRKLYSKPIDFNSIRCWTPYIKITFIKLINLNNYFLPSVIFSSEMQMSNIFRANKLKCKYYNVIYRAFSDLHGTNLIFYKLFFGRKLRNKFWQTFNSHISRQVLKI